MDSLLEVRSRGEFIGQTERGKESDPRIEVSTRAREARSLQVGVQFRSADFGAGGAGETGESCDDPVSLLGVFPTLVRIDSSMKNRSPVKC